MAKEKRLSSPHAELVCSKQQRRSGVKRMAAILAAVSGIGFPLFGSAIAPRPAAAQGNEMVIRAVYDDRMTSLFRDESWTKRNERSREYVRSGKASMQFDADWWGGIQFHNELVDLRGATDLSVWLAGGAGSGQNLRVQLKVNGNVSGRVIRGLDNEWSEVRIPLSEVGGAPRNRANVEVTVSGDVDADQPPVYVDDINFVGPAAGNVRPPGNEPFSGGLISFSFDDNGGGQAKYARSILNNAGIKATFYTVTDYTYPNDIDSNLGVTRARQLANDGHEIAAHSITHRSMNELSPADLEREMTVPISFIRSNFGQNVRSMATPSGQYGERELQLAEQYYTSHRTALDGLNDFANDPYQLFIYDGSIEVNKLISYIEEARVTDRWLIFMYHDINESGQGFFTASRANLQTIVDYVKNSGIPTVRVDEGVDRLRRRVVLTGRPNSNGKPKAILTVEQARNTPILPATTAPAPTAAPTPTPASTAAPAPTAAPTALAPVTAAPAPATALAPVTAAPAPAQQPSKPAPPIPTVPPVKVAPAQQPPKPPVAAVPVVASVPTSSTGVWLYSEGLGRGVEDWSWAPRNMVATTPARGKRSIVADLSNWKGVYFHGSADLRSTAALELWLHGGVTGGQQLKLSARTANANYGVVILPGLKKQGWTKVRIPLAKFGIRPTAAPVVFDVQLAGNVGKQLAPIAVDDVRFTR